MNVKGVETDSGVGAAGLDRGRLKVGDAVGFRERQNQERYGRVLALNRKTATMITGDEQRLRVAYQFLFPVIDSNEGLEPEQ